MADVDLDSLFINSSEGDKQNIQFAWYYIVRYYIKTPRDVRRFINSFAIAFAAVGNYTDPSDLLVLEALRLFEPSVYQYVRTNISELWD